MAARSAWDQVEREKIRTAEDQQKLKELQYKPVVKTVKPSTMRE